MTSTFKHLLATATLLATGAASATNDLGWQFIAGSGTLTFAPGETSKTITVDIANDAVFEGSTGETFFVNLTTPVNATIADNQGLGTIIDNDEFKIAVGLLQNTFNGFANIGRRVVGGHHDDDRACFVVDRSASASGSWHDR